MRAIYNAATGGESSTCFGLDYYFYFCYLLVDQVSQLVIVLRLIAANRMIRQICESKRAWIGCHIFLFPLI